VISHVSYSDMWAAHHDLSIRLGAFLIFFPPLWISFFSVRETSSSNLHFAFHFPSIRRTEYTFFFTRTPLIGSSIYHHGNPHNPTLESWFHTSSKDEVDLPQRHLGLGTRPLGLGVSRTARETFLHKQRRTLVNAPHYSQKWVFRR
jgi:hypothetical protein